MLGLYTCPNPWNAHNWVEFDAFAVAPIPVPPKKTVEEQAAIQASFLKDRA